MSGGKRYILGLDPGSLHGERASAVLIEQTPNGQRTVVVGAMTGEPPRKPPAYEALIVDLSEAGFPPGVKVHFASGRFGSDQRQKVRSAREAFASVLDPMQQPTTTPLKTALWPAAETRALTLENIHNHPTFLRAVEVCGFKGALFRVELGNEAAAGVMLRVDHPLGAWLSATAVSDQLDAEARALGLDRDVLRRVKAKICRHIPEAARAHLEEIEPIDRRLISERSVTAEDVAKAKAIAEHVEGAITLMGGAFDALAKSAETFRQLRFNGDRADLMVDGRRVGEVTGIRSDAARPTKAEREAEAVLFQSMVASDVVVGDSEVGTLAYADTIIDD